MVRRSFSNPFLRVFTRRRSKNEGDEHDNRRKESLDQTVLSGDDSRFNRSMTSADGGVGISTGNTNDMSIATNKPPSTLRRGSNSDPMIKSPSLAAEPCQCIECIESRDLLFQNASQALATDQEVEASSRYQPAQRHFLTAPSPMNTVHNQDFFVHPPSNNFGRDPTIQARIEAVEIQQRLLGESHPDVIFSLSSLAKLCQRRGDFELALSIMRESQVRSMKAKTSMYKQQGSNTGQQEYGAIVPSEISFSCSR